MPNTPKRLNRNDSQGSPRTMRDVISAAHYRMLLRLQDRRRGFARVSVARMPPSSPEGGVHGVPREAMSPSHRSD